MKEELLIRPVAFAAVPFAAFLLSGCLAKAALDVATAPVRVAGQVAGKAADAATTSQSERDEQAGRALRQHEERYSKLQREYARQIDACGEGSMAACDKADKTRIKLAELRARQSAMR